MKAPKLLDQLRRIIRRKHHSAHAQPDSNPLGYMEFDEPQSKTPKGYDFSAISYLDILGFRAFMLQAERSELERVVSLGTKAMEKAGLSIAQVIGQPWRRVCQFQDSFVAVSELGWSEHDPGSVLKALKYQAGCRFTQEVANICNIQMNFLRHGRLIRGALTIGEVTIQGQSVLGPGWDRAYSLESLAKFPRVILDCDLAKELAASPEMASQSLHRALKRDEDGKVFINYLRGSAPAYLSFTDFAGLLDEHQHLVMKLCKDYATFPEAREKIKWLVQYHNQEIDHWQNLILQYTDSVLDQWKVSAVAPFHLC